MAKNAACKILVGTVQGNNRTHPLSRNGWAAARRDARSIAEGPGKWLALVDLECPGGRIPMYQCSQETGSSGRKYVACAIEAVGDPDQPSPPIAGRVRRHAKRRNK
jgi:hypothetical protein